MAWFRPTSHTENGWANPTWAYNGDTTNYASFNISTGWSTYLEMYFTETNIDQIRLYTSRQNDQVSHMQMDVYYDGVWNNIYDGVTLAADGYNTIDIGEHIASGVRYRVYRGSGGGTRWAGLNDTELFEVVAVIPPEDKIDSDTLSLQVTEEETLASDIQKTDSLQVTVTEIETLISDIQKTDFLQVIVTETASLTTELTASDSLSLQTDEISYDIIEILDIQAEDELAISLLLTESLEISLDLFGQDTFVITVDDNILLENEINSVDNILTAITEVDLQENEIEDQDNIQISLVDLILAQNIILEDTDNINILISENGIIAGAFVGYVIERKVGLEGEWQHLDNVEIEVGNLVKPVLQAYQDEDVIVLIGE